MQVTESDFREAIRSAYMAGAARARKRVLQDVELPSLGQEGERSMIVIKAGIAVVSTIVAFSLFDYLLTRIRNIEGYVFTLESDIDARIQELYVEVVE